MPAPFASTLSALIVAVAVALSGSIAVSADEPSAEPAVEPTSEPTAEPAVEPTAEPAVELPARPTVGPAEESPAEPSPTSDVGVANPSPEPAVPPGLDETTEPADPQPGDAFSMEASLAAEPSLVEQPVLLSADDDVQGRVWRDWNHNGRQDSIEVGSLAVSVELQDAVGGVVATSGLDGDGLYGFPVVAPGTYRLHFVDNTDPTRTGVAPTLPDVGTDDSDSDIGYDYSTPLFTFTGTQLDFDAGFVPATRIGNYVWHDRDSDGIQDPNEPGVSGVTVELWNTDKTERYDQTTTDTNGEYTLTATHGPIDYRVRVIPPTDATFAPLDADSDDSDSDINPTGPHTGYTDIIELASNIISITNYDAGLLMPELPTAPPSPPTSNPAPTPAGSGRPGTGPATGGASTTSSAEVTDSGPVEGDGADSENPTAGPTPQSTDPSSDAVTSEPDSGPGALPWILVALGLAAAIGVTVLVLRARRG